jgi:hypothetical protein
MISTLFLSLISVHWGFATGAILASRTDWSFPRFLIIILLIKIFTMSYATQN